VLSGGMAMFAAVSRRVRGLFVMCFGCGRHAGCSPPSPAFPKQARGACPPNCKQPLEPAQNPGYPHKFEWLRRIFPPLQDETRSGRVPIQNAAAF